MKKTQIPSFARPLGPEPALQAALAVNKELNELLDAAGVAVVLVDRQMHILRFTRTAAELLHLSSGEVGRPVGHLLSRLVSDDSPVVDIQAMLDTLSPWDAQVQTTAGLWFKLGVRPHQTLDNIIEGAVITLVDFTEMKRLEKALLEGEERYRAMVEWSPEAINILRDGKFIYVNSAAIELYGATSAQDLLGQPSRDRVHPDDLESALLRMKSLTLHGVSAPLVEMTFFKLDG